MDSQTPQDRIEVYGLMASEILEELASQALIDGVSLEPGGLRCGEQSEVIDAAWRASEEGRPLVLYSTWQVPSFAGIEDVLTCHHVAHQIVAPFRANGTDFQARHYDGRSMFFRKMPLEGGEPINLYEDYGAAL